MNNEALLMVVAKLLISGEIRASTLANWLVAVDVKNPLEPEEQQVLRAWIADPQTALQPAQRDLLLQSLHLSAVPEQIDADQNRAGLEPSMISDAQGDLINSDKNNTFDSNWWDDLPATPLSGDLAETLHETLSAKLAVDDEQINSQELRGILSILAEESRSEPQSSMRQVDTDPAQPLDSRAFHLSLSQWIDDERVQPSGKDDPQNIWDYDFWKADLIARSPLDAAQRSQLLDDGSKVSANEFFAYTVDVFFGEETDPRRYQYWVELNPDGQVKRSDWIDQAAPPDRKDSAFSDWSGRQRSSALLDADLLREIYLKSIREQEHE